jgi:hypothetical protein
MKMGHRWLVAGALALLAGCHGQESPADKGTDRGAKAAGGEVLPGSVSDAMIDLDGATGTPPLQPPPLSRWTGSRPSRSRTARAGPKPRHR